MIFPKKHIGNAQVEYILPILLFVTIGGFLVLNSMQTPMINRMADSVNGKVSGSQIIVPSQGTVDLPYLTNSLEELKAGSGLEQICYASGLCLQVPLIQAGAVDTTGGLGGNETLKMAAVLSQVADALENVKADPQLVNLVTSLAEKGHELGVKNQELESHCEIKSYDIRCSEETGRSAFETFKTYGPEFSALNKQLQDYLKNHPDALKNYPEAQKVINLETSEILKIANGITNYSHSFGGNYFHIIPGKTELAHQSANSICSQGGDSDRCYVNTGDGWRERRNKQSEKKISQPEG